MCFVESKYQIVSTLVGADSQRLNLKRCNRYYIQIEHYEAIATELIRQRVEVNT